MNRAHIVSANTGPTGFMTEVAHVVGQSLGQAGWMIDTVDLTHWSAVLAAGAKPGGDALVENERDRILRSDLLVLVFPVIWCSMPAALKQWIDIVFCDRSAQGGTQTGCQGCMRGKKAIVVAASEEVERMQRSDSMEASMAIMLRPLLEGTLNFLGFSVLRPVFIDRDQLQNIQTTGLLNQVADAFSHLESRPNFYGVMRPKPGLSSISM